MILQERIELMARLGEYMQGNDPGWLEIRERAFHENQWFIPEFIDRSVENIARYFLDPALLVSWAAAYQVPDHRTAPKTVGVVMAGNIPLVGFHDFLCIFISGHHAVIKPSSKDQLLITHLVQKLYDWEIAIQNDISFAERLKGCDAFIATGSNNSGRYFDYYFGRFPHIIRKNRTSVAILSGAESKEQLNALSDDIQVYFGLGCRNITKLFVPRDYDFLPLLDALKKFDYFMDFHKYKNNFDYHLALLIMGNRYYMNNDVVVLTENTSPFSPVSQVHYEFYDDRAALGKKMAESEEVQCIVGHGCIPFGMAQSPGLTDYADGVDTMAFLAALA